VAAFPGSGKTWYHKRHPDTTLDSDSSSYSWVNVDGMKVRNPDFPENYLRHIQENLGKREWIFVSTHKEVRDALLDRGLFFYLAYPQMQDKELYLKRYEARGSSKEFMDLVDRNWHTWLTELSQCRGGCRRIEMSLEFGCALDLIRDFEEGDAPDPDTSDASTSSMPDAWLWTMLVSRNGRRTTVSWPTLCDSYKDAVEECEQVFECKVIGVRGFEELYGSGFKPF
jgi:hypothetical protein